MVSNSLNCDFDVEVADDCGNFIDNGVVTAQNTWARYFEFDVNEVRVKQAGGSTWTYSAVTICEDVCNNLAFSLCAFSGELCSSGSLANQTYSIKN